MTINRSKKPSVPKQKKGARSDTSHFVQLNTQEEAKVFFNIVKNRLLDVTNWHKRCGLVTATFILTDRSGNKVKRLAKQGDYLRIDIPGPGSKAGDGYDWARIEAIENKNNATDDYDELLMRARPAKNPNDHAKQTSHFFKEDASSTFMVVRERDIVKAEIHGRNELPNIRQDTLLDTIRNAITALGATLGFSKSQWQKLVKGLVARKEIS